MAEKKHRRRKRARAIPYPARSPRIRPRRPPPPGPIPTADELWRREQEDARERELTRAWEEALNRAAAPGSHDGAALTLSAAGHERAPGSVPSGRGRKRKKTGGARPRFRNAARSGTCRHGHRYRAAGVREGEKSVKKAHGRRGVGANRARYSGADDGTDYPPAPLFKILKVRFVRPGG